MTRPNDKNKIIEHYDVVSSFYRSPWGEHLNHGYWIRGDESKDKAQLQLTEHLAQLVLWSVESISHTEPRTLLRFRREASKAARLLRHHRLVQKEIFFTYSMQTFYSNALR